MVETTTYQYLAPRAGSRYRQYFYKGRNLRAETLYRATISPEAMTPEAVAEDFEVPVEAVHEAIRYCLANEDLLRLEREQDWSESQARTASRSGGISKTDPVTEVSVWTWS